MGPLPPEAAPEIKRSVQNLRNVRTPRDAMQAFETETERLLTAMMPTLVARPLRVRSNRAAKLIVATAGGIAAAGEEMEALATLVSYGAALPPALPVMLGTNIVALAVEVYVAASLRVNVLVDAGFEPDPREIARDVIFAMTGKVDDRRWVRKRVTKRMVKSVAARVIARWGTALVPLAGIVYSGWDAQRTIDGIRGLPLPERPPPSFLGRLLPSLRRLRFAPAT